MTQPELIPLVESELAMLGVPFDRAELMAYVASMWPWMEDDPDMGRWAREFIEARFGPADETICFGGGGE